jgi:malate dehydrogenase (oxaloacetate-decarboxylating)
MRPLPPPFDRIAAGRTATIPLRGATLLAARLLSKDLAFSEEERDAFGLRGLLPTRVLTIQEQVQLELEHLRRKSDDLEAYIGLAALQDRNSTLFYRLLAENLEEFLPIVYTPTVGRACQQWSHILRRTRGTWITPDDVDRIPRLLRHVPYEDVRLIVVTDNERILGLGDQGAGGIGIPIGKLALYTAACGIHPAVTLPVSLDVGTDNHTLLNDPLYLGYRAPRLRGPAYDRIVEAFVEGVAEVWPGCLVQWEDFKQGNAMRILDRYRERVPSFNDDIQGTSATVLAGVLAGLRATGQDLAHQRIVLAGAGAAGIGIARLLRLALLEAGMDREAATRAIVALDSKGLVHDGRSDIDEAKRDFAIPAGLAASVGLDLGGERPPGLLEVVRAVRPTVLVGTTGVPGTFTEAVIRAVAEGMARPLILPLSNPTSATEARPSDIIEWTDGRALVATGSPFPPVEHAGVQHVVGQANNAFVFPGIGLGTIVAEARKVSDAMVFVAARTVAGLVTDDRLAVGALYPPVDDLRMVSREIAVAVAREAVDSGLAGVSHEADIPAEVDGAMWWPDYAPYEPR